MLQFGQDQGGVIISTGGIPVVFRGLKWEPNADIGRNGAFVNWLTDEEETYGNSSLREACP